MCKRSKKKKLNQERAFRNTYKKELAIKEGEENGVTWSIDSSKFNPIIIKVRNSNDEEETYNHKLLHPNAIFGYDVSDIEEVNSQLDRLIQKYKIEK